MGGLVLKRGEVWWVNFPAPTGRRPCVLVSRNEAYGLRTRLTVVPLTQTRRELPTEIPLSRADGVPKDCVANTDEVTTVSRRMIDQRVCALTESKILALNRALMFALALP